MAERIRNHRSHVGLLTVTIINQTNIEVACIFSKAKIREGLGFDRDNRTRR